jgi:GNAT superfamily N-acetyltransferase
VSSWTPQRVLDAMAAMEWRPDGAIEVPADDYRLVRYPDWALDPIVPAAQVTRSRTGRSADEVIDEVLACVRAWGLPGVAWWVSAATMPSGTGDRLRARGGKQIDAVRLLARELGGGLPELDVPPDVTVELVTNETLFRTASAVTVRGWGRREPDEAELARDLALAGRDLAEWAGWRVVAFADGEAASTGGCTLDGEVVRLWGAVTLPAFRRRGCYRAVLAERLRLARDHGATLALVKGRAETSGPILLRAGFTDHGEERCYWLPVGATCPPT